MDRSNALRSKLAEMMNGRLTVTMIVLEMDLKNQATVSLSHADDENMSPFLPFLAAELDYSDLEPFSTSFEIDGEKFDLPPLTLDGRDEHEGEIGLGSQRCVAYSGPHLLGREGGEVFFGRAVGTLVDYAKAKTDLILHADPEGMYEFFEDELVDFYRGPQSSLLSLWDTDIPGVAVMAIERLTISDGRPLMTIDHRIDRLIGLLAEFSDSDEINLSSLGLKVPVGTADGPLSEIIVRSLNSVRGQTLARAVTLQLESDMQSAVDDFMKSGTPDADFDDVEDQQTSGYVPIPDVLSLVSSPVSDQNFSAISSDGRLVLINIDSMSVNHDYMGSISSKLAVSVMPVLSDLGSIELLISELRAGLDTFRADASRSEQQERLIEIKVRQMQRTLVHASANQEQSIVWSNSGHLASRLYLQYEDQRAIVDALTSSVVQTFEAIDSKAAYFRAIREQKARDEDAQWRRERAESEERERRAEEARRRDKAESEKKAKDREMEWRQERDDLNAKVATAAAIVATIFAVVGAFAAMVAIPPGPAHILADYAVPIAIVPTIFLCGVIIWWWMKKEPFDASPEESDEHS